ncbi:MAG: OmpA family protein [Pseudohongiellaceae bacterium]
MFGKCFLATTLIFYSISLHAQSKQEVRNNISPNESFGFIGGAILGGLSGGPPGVLLGAGFGALLGDKWTSNRYALEEMRIALDKSNLELIVAKNELAKVSQKYNPLNSVQDVQLISFSNDSALDVSCCESKISINFKTGRSEIEKHYEEELKMLAKQAISLKNSKIEILGYADRNGSASENFELSKRRNLSVEKFLTENGVNRASITTLAYGDTMPLQLDSSYESNFFDRRVSIHLRVDDNLVTSHLVEDVK